MKKNKKARLQVFSLLLAAVLSCGPVLVSAELIPLDPVLPAPSAPTLPTIPTAPAPSLPSLPAPSVGPAFSDFDVFSSLMEAEGYTVTPSGGASGKPYNEKYLDDVYSAYSRWASDKDFGMSPEEWLRIVEQDYEKYQDFYIAAPTGASPGTPEYELELALSRYLGSLRMKCQDGWVEITPGMYQILAQIQYAGLPDCCKPLADYYPDYDEYPYKRFACCVSDKHPVNRLGYLSCSSPDVRLVACETENGSYSFVSAFLVSMDTVEGRLSVVVDNNGNPNKFYVETFPSESGFFYCELPLLGMGVNGTQSLYGFDYVFQGTIEGFLGKLADNPDLWDSPETVVASLPDLDVDITRALPYPSIDDAVADGRIRKEDDRYYFPVHETDVGPDTNPNNREKEDGDEKDGEDGTEAVINPGPKPGPDPGPGPEPDTEPDTEDFPGGIPPDIVDGSSWKNLFPFCIPWDLMTMVKMLRSERKAPRFQFKHTFKTVGSKGLGGGRELYTLEIDVDMADYWDYIKIFRWGQTIFFIIALFFLTVKFTTFVYRMGA